MTPDEKLKADLGQHLSSRVLREMAEEQENKFKRLVLDDLITAGEETPEGHYVYEFVGENDDLGLVLGDGRTVSSVKREKRSTTALDPEAVDKLLPEALHDQVFQNTVTISGLTPSMAMAVMEGLADIGVPPDKIEEDEVLSEDDLLALNYENVVSDDDLKAMYHEAKVIYALKVSYAR